MTRRNLFGLLAQVVALVYGLFLSSCRTRPMTLGEQFHRLFAGFQLVSIASLPAGDIANDPAIGNLQGNLPLDEVLVPGRAYFFTKTMRESWADLALDDLPSRLSAIRAHIRKAPKSSQDLMYLYVGGPTFRIEFDLDGHRGQLFNWFGGIDQNGKLREKLILEYR